MKKVLFATTALVATAGIASADVSLSGSAEMGIVGGDAYGNTTQFHGDIDVTFSLSAQSDNGLTFGANVDLDESDGSGSCTLPGTRAGNATAKCTVSGASPAFGSTTQGGEVIFISGAFGTLTLGDTDGAIDWAMKEVNVVGGSLDDAETSHSGFNGNGGLDGTNDGQILRYDYSFGSFAVAASVEIDDTGVAASGDVYGLGVKYNADFGGIMVGFGLGAQTDDLVDYYGVSVDADFGNGFKAAINYMDRDTLGDFWGVGAGYTMNALSIGVNYGQYSPNVGASTDGYGLAVDYDLGGGAAVQFGYGSSNPAVGATTDQWSFGVSMSF